MDSLNIDLEPIHSPEIEQAVVACSLISGDASDLAVKQLVPTDFYVRVYRQVFESIASIRAKGSLPTPLTVGDDLRKRGIEITTDTVRSIAATVEDAGEIAVFVEILRSRSAMRRLDAIGVEISALARRDGDPVDALKEAAALVESVPLGGKQDRIRALSELVDEYSEGLNDIVDNGLPTTGLKTRLVDLDVRAPVRVGELYIVGGRPAMGKSGLAGQLAVGVAHGGHGGVIFSLEMTAEQYVKRMVSAEAGVSTSVWSTGRVSPRDYDELMYACERLRALPIWIEDATDQTVTDMRSAVRRIKSRGVELGIAVVDYIQIVSTHGRGDSRAVEVGRITRGLKAMAKDEKLGVVALSQISRATENRDNKRPTLADLRESGSIEADADVVALLYRDAYYKAQDEESDSGVAPSDDPYYAEEAEVIIAKQRHGPTGKVTLAFKPACVRFGNLGTSDEYQPSRHQGFLGLMGDPLE